METVTNTLGIDPGVLAVGSITIIFIACFIGKILIDSMNDSGGKKK